MAHNLEKQVNREIQNERRNGIMREELYKSSYKCVQEFKVNMDIMRREIETIQKKQMDLLELKSRIYELKKPSVPSDHGTGIHSCGHQAGCIVR